MKNMKALICVRSGSVRVPLKNIRPFAGSSLLEIKIKSLLELKNINGIVVNSDSDEMLNIAKNLGVEVVKRDPFFATSEISANEFYKNVAQNIDCDIVLSTTVTTPFVKKQTLDKAILTYKSLSSKYDSLVSVTALKDFLWINGAPANYSIKHKPRSQDIPENFTLLNHAINIIPRQLMIECMDIIGRSPYLFYMPKNESIDIDDIEDFEYAEYKYKQLPTKK